MSRLLFTKSHKVQQHDGKGPLYEAGKVYEFNGFSAETYAAKYKRLGLAVDAIEVIKAAAEKYERVIEPVTFHEVELPEGITGNVGPGPHPAGTEIVVCESGPDAREKAWAEQPKRRGRPPKNA
jgi:hypothetical protein